MVLEQIVYSLPSAQAFLHAITDDGSNDVKIVLIPDNLSREMVGRLIRNRFADSGLSMGRLFDPGNASPVLASAGAMNVSWPSPRTLRAVENLLCCEDLPDVFYVHRIGGRKEWTEFIQGWARTCCNLRSSGQSKVPSICVIAKLRDFAFDLPPRDPGISLHWWWGFPSALEMRLACRIASNQYGSDSGASVQWREYVLPGLVSNDVQLAEHMWDQILNGTDHTLNGLVDYWKNVEDPSPADSVDDITELVKTIRTPYSVGQELPETLRSLWAGGVLVYTPEYGLEIHPALLAYGAHRTSVEHMLWRGQSELLLPIVNEVRLRVCEDLTNTYGPNWPIRWVPPSHDQDLAEVIRSPLGTELSHVNYLLQSLGVRNPRHDLYQKKFVADLVLRAKNVRNEIAHYNPVALKDFEGLCEERKKVGI